ncbi:SRPBCC domain-containing protein [Deinococcus detaillensis]|uniref:SRPBCC domain-containing protein n=1 Tax=Deinococcus detaillensis TaxID=2592048 RepID=UPI00298D1426|nr:SRPBCC domain-containing protein [Deinococcus detaillensis]
MGGSFLFCRTPLLFEIGAAPERVWEVLTDAGRYPEWNPVIVRLEGELKAGKTIEFENRSGKSSMVFRPKVLTVTPDKELRWLGRLWVPGLFDGEHAFVLDEVRPGVTRLRHGERFRGLLVPFLHGWIRGSVREDFTRINAALKERAEQAT